MAFWETLLSPAGFAIGLICTLMGAIIGHVLTRCSKSKDDSQALIQNVAERYHELRQTNRTDGAHGLLESGVCRLRNSAEIEASIRIIQDFGHREPLSTIRDRLEGKDIHSFFVVLRDKKLNPLQHKDLEIAIEAAKPS